MRMRAIASVPDAGSAAPLSVMVAPAMPEIRQVPADRDHDGSSVAKPARPTSALRPRDLFAAES